MAMKIKNIDLSKISITNPRKLDYGGSMAFINYDGQMGPFHIQTPEVEITFDASYFSDDDKNGKWGVRASFNDLDNKKQKEFHDFLSNMDSFLKEKAFENSVQWFKGKKSKDAIDSLYTPMLKIHMDPETGEPSGKFSNSFSFKIHKKNNKIECDMYDKHKFTFDINHETENPVNIESLIVKGSRVQVLLKCNGVWFANGKFGCTWKAEQICTQVPENRINEFAIITDSDEEIDTDDNNNILNNSSDEEEDVQPEPPKEPKKKTRKVKVKTSN